MSFTVKGMCKPGQLVHRRKTAAAALRKVRELSRAGCYDLHVITPRGQGLRCFGIWRYSTLSCCRARGELKQSTRNWQRAESLHLSPCSVLILSMERCSRRCHRHGFLGSPVEVETGINAKRRTAI
jgi:hypothetical protein